MNPERVLYPFQEINNQSTLEVRPERVRPVPDIQDEPVRCFKVNLEWCKFVAGAMSELLNLQAWAGVDNEQHDTIQQIIRMLEGDDCMDCNDVEDCLQTSQTITNINTTITQVAQDQQECCELTSQVVNIYPPAPSNEQAIDLCSSAVYVAQQLSTLWHDVVTDAQTITWEEFISAFIPGNQGYDVSLLKQLWDYIVSNANPNLVTEGEAAFNEIVKIIFCNEFDRDLIDLEIDGSTTITSDAKGLWRGALSSVTDGKIATWVFLGSLQGLSNTECVCFEICGVHDFTIDDGDWSIETGLFNHPGFYDAGLGWRADLSPREGVGQNNVIHIGKSFTAQFVQSIEMTYNLTKGEFIGSQSDTAVSIDALLDGVSVTSLSVPFNVAVNGDGQTLLLDVDAEIDEIRLVVRSSRDITVPNPIGDGLITRCVVVCQ